MFGLYSDLPQEQTESGVSVEKVEVKQRTWAVPRLKPSLKKSAAPAAAPEFGLSSRSSGLADARSVSKDGRRLRHAYFDPTTHPAFHLAKECHLLTSLHDRSQGVRDSLLQPNYSASRCRGV